MKYDPTHPPEEITFNAGDVLQFATDLVLLLVNFAESRGGPTRVEFGRALEASLEGRPETPANTLLATFAYAITASGDPRSGMRVVDGGRDGHDHDPSV